LAIGNLRLTSKPVKLKAGPMSQSDGSKPSHGASARQIGG